MRLILVYLIFLFLGKNRHELIGLFMFYRLNSYLIYHSQGFELPCQWQFLIIFVQMESYYPHQLKLSILLNIMCWNLIYQLSFNLFLFCLMYHLEFIDLFTLVNVCSFITTFIVCWFLSFFISISST